MQDLANDMDVLGFLITGGKYDRFISVVGRLKDHCVTLEVYGLDRCFIIDEYDTDVAVIEIILTVNIEKIAREYSGILHGISDYFQIETVTMGCVIGDDVLKPSVLLIGQDRGATSDCSQNRDLRIEMKRKVGVHQFINADVEEIRQSGNYGIGRYS